MFECLAGAISVLFHIGIKSFLQISTTIINFTQSLVPPSRIIVIGASAGGVEALCGLVQKLPGDWPAVVFIAMHIGPGSILPEILNRCRGDGSVEFPRNRERATPGHIYVAPPGRHMAIHGAQVWLTKATKEDRFNPSVDFLFQSAAKVFGPRVIGIILTGLMNDGAEGISAIKAKGGVAVVQDPKEAEFPEMPLNAIRAASVDYCLPLAQMPALLQELVAQTS